MQAIARINVRVESDSFGEGVDVEIEKLNGSEAISSLYRFELRVVADAPLSPERVLRSPLTIVFELIDDSHEPPRQLRKVRGIVSELCDELSTSEVHWTYTLSVVPVLWLSTMVRAVNVFIGLGVPELIDTKLRLSGMADGHDFGLRLLSRYPTREFTVQYEESDYDFVARLAEHVGISFWFESTEHDEQVVFSDENSAFVRRQESVPYRSRGEHWGVVELRRRHRAVPRFAILRDYNERNPALDLTIVAELDEGGGGGVVEYGAQFQTVEHGEQLAQVRVQEQRCNHDGFEGVCDSAILQAGEMIHISDHPSGDFEVLIAEVEHCIVQPTSLRKHADVQAVSYQARFRAVPAASTFRPARRTPQPRIGGVVTGVIQSIGNTLPQGGPSLPMPPIGAQDSDGRYRVALHFELPGRDASHQGGPAGMTDGIIPSLPMRMGRSFAGASYGMHMPLRVGVEVLVAFINGDPDRPVIVCAVPNAETPDAVTSFEPNKSRIVTQTGIMVEFSDG